MQRTETASGRDPEHERRGVEQSEKHRGGTPGIWRDLGDLPQGAIVTEEALARIFGRHQVSIKRAVDRGELPPPTRLLGGPVWTAGAILSHLEERLAAARKEREKAAKKIQELCP